MQRLLLRLAALAAVLGTVAALIAGGASSGLDGTPAHVSIYT